MSQSGPDSDDGSSISDAYEEKKNEIKESNDRLADIPPPSLTTGAVEIVVHDVDKSTMSGSSSSNRGATSVSVPTRMKSLLFDAQFADVTFLCGDSKNPTQIGAHRIVLAARSPVFAAMFYSQFAESANAVIPMPNVSVHLLEHLLYILYTDDTSYITARTFLPLSFLARQFQISRIVDVCAGAIRSVLTIENACQILGAIPAALADDAQVARTFIEEHATQIFLGGHHATAPFAVMEELLRSDRLCCPETVVAEALIYYAGERNLDAPTFNKLYKLLRLSAFLPGPAWNRYVVPFVAAEQLPYVHANIVKSVEAAAKAKDLPHLRALGSALHVALSINGGHVTRGPLHSGLPRGLNGDAAKRGDSSSSFSSSNFSSSASAAAIVVPALPSGQQQGPTNFARDREFLSAFAKGDTASRTAQILEAAAPARDLIDPNDRVFKPRASDYGSYNSYSRSGDKEDSDRLDGKLNKLMNQIRRRNSGSSGPSKIKLSWICGSCTFHNNPGRDRCEMCDSKAPNFVFNTRSTSQWVCDHCTVHNAHDAPKCTTCNAARTDACKEAVVPSWEEFRAKAEKAKVAAAAAAATGSTTSSTAEKPGATSSDWDDSNKTGNNESKAGVLGNDATTGAVSEEKGEIPTQSECEKKVEAIGKEFSFALRVPTAHTASTRQRILILYGGHFSDPESVSQIAYENSIKHSFIRAYIYREWQRREAVGKMEFCPSFVLTVKKCARTSDDMSNPLNNFKRTGVDLALLMAHDVIVLATNVASNSGGSQSITRGIHPDVFPLINQFTAAGGSLVIDASSFASAAKELDGSLASYFTLSSNGLPYSFRHPKTDTELSDASLSPLSLERATAMDAIGNFTTTGDLVQAGHTSVRMLMPFQNQGAPFPFASSPGVVPSSSSYNSSSSSSSSSMGEIITGDREIAMCVAAELDLFRDAAGGVWIGQKGHKVSRISGFPTPSSIRSREGGAFDPNSSRNAAIRNFLKNAPKQSEEGESSATVAANAAASKAAASGPSSSSGNYDPAPQQRLSELFPPSVFRAGRRRIGMIAVTGICFAFPHHSFVWSSGKYANAARNRRRLNKAMAAGKHRAGSVGSASAAAAAASAASASLSNVPAAPPMPRAGLFIGGRLGGFPAGMTSNNNSSQSVSSDDADGAAAEAAESVEDIAASCMEEMLETELSGGSKPQGDDVGALMLAICLRAAAASSIRAEGDLVAVANTTIASGANASPTSSTSPLSAAVASGLAARGVSAVFPTAQAPETEDALTKSKREDREKATAAGWGVPGHPSDSDPDAPAGSVVVPGARMGRGVEEGKG